MEWDRIDKRRFLRVEFPYTVHIRTEEGKDISTYAENISRGGVGLVLKDKLNPKDNLILKIYMQDVPVECKGQVIWVKEKNNPMLDNVNFFETGIEFKDMDKESEAKIDSCLKELEQGTGMDKPDK